MQKYFLFKVSKPVISAFILLFFRNSIWAQQNAGGALKGLLVERTSGNPAPFVNVTLYSRTDSTLSGGTQSRDDGTFELTGIASGKYMLRLTSVSYVLKTIEIEMGHPHIVNLDTLLLSDGQLSLQQVTVRGEREKAKTDLSKTTFQISTRMRALAASGVELLQQLPGVSIDLAQNITVEGSTKVIILVNGMERDNKYLSQLPAADVDKIEIMANPPARYDASVSRVINVVLKTDRRGGLSGNLNVETPTMKKQIYTFPSARLSYGRGRLDAFVSYGGSLGYFDIVEKSRREGTSADGKTGISSYRNGRQKNWSHRFNYGLDYVFNKQNSVTFYGNFNPYSQELDGQIQAFYERETAARWDYRKEDTDRNRGSFYSLFYKGTFGKRRVSELTVDGSLYHLRAKNQTVFTDLATDSVQINLVRPVQNTFNLRADYSLPITKTIRLITGFQMKTNRSADRNQSGFRYRGGTQALYGGGRFSKQKVASDVSLRMERVVLGSTGSNAVVFTAFLPNLSFQYQLREGISLKANYQKALEYPGFYQLNPFLMLEDPHTYRSGNPALRPAGITNGGLEYSRSFVRNFISLRAFYHERQGIINDLTRLTDKGDFVTQLFNLGKIQQIGTQLTGTFSIGKSIQLQSYTKLFRVFTVADRFAAGEGLQNRQRTAYELAVSGSISLPYQFALAAQATYNSPTIEMQKTVFTHPLYFVSLQKSFGNSVRAAVTFALPFGRTFTYQGEKIRSESIASDVEKTIHLTVLPVFLKASYTFSKGGKRKQVIENSEDTGTRQKKGF